MGKYPGFCGPSYTSQSLSVDAQKLMNWYLERAESGDANNDFVLYPSPGTKTFIQFTPPPPPSPFPTGQFGVQNTLIQISAATLKNASVTPIQLIPAPSAPNHAIIPLSMVLQINFNTTPYTTDPGAAIGFGTTPSDIINNGFMMFPTGTISPTFFQLNYTAVDFTTVSAAGQGAGAFNPTTHVVNQPLFWANNHNITGDSGDSTITINIQWIEVDVTTGIIYNGQSNSVWGSRATLTAPQLSTTVPVQMVPSPGPGLMTIPLSMVFRNIAQTSSANDRFQMQPAQDALATNGSSARPTPPPSKVLNTPLGYVSTVIGFGTNQTDILNAGAFPVNYQVGGGDTSTGAICFIQYLVLNPSTGALIKAGVNGGDVTYSFTNLSAAQLKNAKTAPVALSLAPGANLIAVPVGFAVESQFHTTAFPNSAGNFPNPSVGPAGDTTYADSHYFMGPNFISTPLFTGNGPQLAVGAGQSVQGVNDTPSTELINTPITWGDNASISGSSADSTGTVAMQFLVLDTTTGNIVSNPPAATGGNIRGELTIGVVP